MSEAVLFAVVVVQVLVFQFLSLQLTRALPDYLVGFEGLPSDARAAVQTFKRGSGRLRQGLGVLLWISAVLSAFVLPIGRFESRLALTTISLVSSGVFLIGLIRDRRTIRGIAAGLPKPGVRTASLEEASLSRHYPTVWEAVPLALLVATVALTLSLLPRLTAGSTSATLGLYPAMQALFVFGTFVWSRRTASSGRTLPQRARPFLGSGSGAVATAEALRSLELRFFLAAKIGVTTMLGLMQAKVLLSAMGRRQPNWLDLSHWILVVLLLGLFAVYGMKLSGAKRNISVGQPAGKDEIG